MTVCKYWDCGWCYAPEYLVTNSIQGGCFEPEHCPISPLSEPVQYETPMTVNEEEIEKVKAQIKVLEKKLSFLEELEKTKSPVEECYKDWWGEYPTNTWQVDVNRWDAFRAGYNAAYEEKVSEWEPTPQTPEQVADGLKEAFREAVKQGVVSSADKPQTLYDLIGEFLNEIDYQYNTDTEKEYFLEKFEQWLPKHQSAAGSQNACVESAVVGFNDCLDTIKRKLR